MFKLRYLLIMWCIILLFIIVTIVMWIFNDKQDTTEMIDSYIIEKNYENHVQKKTMIHDWKQQTYYAKVVFKDEPGNYYEFYPERRNVLVTGYDKDQNEEIVDKQEGKYMEDH